MTARLLASRPWRTIVRSAAAFALALLVFTAGVGAEGPLRQPSAADQTQRFQRNQALIVALVHGGLHLAAEEDPIQRANHCNVVVKLFAVEMRQAADTHEAGRFAELGQHLRALLEDGVAANLSRARGSIPEGSA